MRRLLRRDRPRPTAVHARVHDGVCLWLAVRDHDQDPRPLALRPREGDDVPVPTEPDADLRTACVELPSSATHLRLVAGTGRHAVGVRLDEPWPTGPTGPTVATPPTPDGQSRWEVATEEGAVVLRRVPVPPHVPVRRFEVVDGRVRVHLGPPATSGHAAVLVHDGAQLTDVPVTEDGAADPGGLGFVVPAEAPVPPGATAVWEVAGHPVVRSANLLRRPQPAVVLPPIGPDDPAGRSPATAGLELRWLVDGRLGLHRARD